LRKGRRRGGREGSEEVSEGEKREEWRIVVRWSGKERVGKKNQKKKEQTFHTTTHCFVL